MEWFSGTVEEALKEYQAKNGLCIVYVTRDEASANDVSTAYDAIWSAFDRGILSGVPVVAIRLHDGSSGAKQFAEFFPLPIVPVCYLLGLHGQPLEVISAAEKLTTDRFNDLLRKGVALYRSQLVESGIAPPSSACDEQVEGRAAEATAEDSEAANPETAGMSMEERVQYVKKRLEEKRKMDEEKKREEEQRKELGRRNEGKLLADLKEKNRERELKEAAEARRREKQDDAAAMKRLREQIKQDREEKLSKTGRQPGAGGILEQSTPPPPKPDSVTPKPVSSEECRIQCKFPNGSTIVKVFSSNGPLQAVVDAINEDGRMSEPFFLVQAYPRRQLNDLSKTFLELELTPSSALLVISQEENRHSSKKSLVPAGGGYLSLLLGILYSPLLAVYNILTGLLNLRGGGAQRQPPTPSRNRSEPEANNRDQRRTDAPTRREGNVTRLRNADDSDSENATWNGNSTQQL